MPSANPKVIVSSPEKDRQLQELQGLAWLLDSSIPIPGTTMRIGLESLIGLVPILGDAVGAALSTFVLARAAQLGVPKVVLVRMSFNVAVEALVGIIPFAGDIFDFVWKANRKNVDLIVRHVEDPRASKRTGLVFITGLSVALLALLAGCGYGGFLLIRWIASSG